MADVFKNFLSGLMNKSSEKKVIPDGQYIDALNVRVSLSDETDQGTAKNILGNTKLTELSYGGNNLSSQATCLRAVKDSANEIIYWFVHDPAFVSSPTGKIDMIVSYSNKTRGLNYHVISINDGGGVNTTLNFDPLYLINGANLRDEYLFFTDFKNEPRYINVSRSYGSPDLGVDGFTANEIKVIKSIPEESPSIELVKNSSEDNYLMDRFISFAYRYRYKDGMYSATSQFSDVAFSPGAFFLNPDENENEGMVSDFNAANISFNTGGKDVVGIDILFKDSSESNIRVIDRIDKRKRGYPDNVTESISFDGSKIYTILPDRELLRLFDNVPRLAGAQTILQGRLMYGNYVEGYDLKDADGSDIVFTYYPELISSEIGASDISTSTTSSNYTIDGAVSVNDSAIVIDLSDKNLTQGSVMSINITYQHSQFTTNTPASTTGPTDITFDFYLRRDYSSVFDLANSQEFIEAVGTASNIQTVPNACDGGTFTDAFNCSIPGFLNNYEKQESGITAVNEPISITCNPGDTSITLQLLAMRFEDGGASVAYEYYEIVSSGGTFREISNPKSLHSGWGYELGMVYMDEHGRQTTVQVSDENNVSIPYGASDLANSIRVTIPITQKAPEWATRYKFVIRSDRDGYETIYSNIFFESSDNSTYFLLEGENQQKIEVGDSLIVKADSNGATDRFIEVKVLEKESKAEDDIVSGSPAGLYMKIKANNFAAEVDPDRVIDYGVKNGSSELGTGGDDEYPFAAYLVSDSDTGADYTVPAGSVITLSFTFKRDGTGSGSCGRDTYILEKTLTSSRDYNSFKDWWDGDNVALSLNDGTYITDGDETENPNSYNDTLLSGASDPTSTDIPAVQGLNQYQFYENTTSGLTYLLVRSGTKECTGWFKEKGRESTVAVRIRVVRGGSPIVFETNPSETIPDIFFENSESFAIDSLGQHSGNVQDQNFVTGDACISDLGFFNCFSFGNGVESYKVNDSIRGKNFRIGERVHSVSNEEYREVSRYSDITYSGVYNDESNINRLNEFNLGLLNFKRCERMNGAIQVLDSRGSDLLCLQENRITYVLAGKNILSDAATGGSVASVPEVLGTQISRIEEIGIGGHPESYCRFGATSLFVDERNGFVVALSGGGYNSDSVDTISNRYMSSYFRDLFNDSFNTQKLIGYDPFNEEWVLSSNDIEVPAVEDVYPCGMEREFTIDNETEDYIVQLGNSVGEVTVTYDVVNLSVGGEVVITANYDGTDYGVTVPTLDPLSGSFTFTKDSFDVNETFVTVETTGTARVILTVSCPDPQELTIIEYVLNSASDEDKLIHTQYRFDDSGYISPTTLRSIKLTGDRDILNVTVRKVTQSFEGYGSFPLDGSNVRIGTNNLQGDDFVFDPVDNEFRYLRSNTLYNDSIVQVGNLLAASSSAGAITSDGNQNYSEFTMPSGSAQYLYLIWDLRKVSSLTLDYNGSSATTACCSGVSSTYYLDANSLEEATAIFTSASLIAKAPDGFYSDGDVVVSQSNGLISGSISQCPSCSGGALTSFSSSSPGRPTQGLSCSLSLTETFYHDGGGATPAVNDKVYTDAAGTSRLYNVYGEGYYQVAGNNWFRIDNTNTVVETGSC